MHVSPYIYRGPTNLRIWEEKHPKTQDLIAIKHYTSTYEQTRTIWMDGRPHPGPERAAHLDGILDRPLRRRHADRRDHAPQAGVGPPQRHADERPGDDDRVLRPQRRHVMTHIVVLIDPVYLTEPLVKSQEFVRSARELPARHVAVGLRPGRRDCDARAEGDVPAYLPGEHPFKDEFARRHQLPEIAVRGGAATMYPEFQEVAEEGAEAAAAAAAARPARSRVDGRQGQQQQGR